MTEMELHLIVLWEKARVAEERILADISTKLEIVATGILSWPGDAETCFGEFYGANLPEAKGKVMECGEGAFRYVVVRDKNPIYTYEDTSRGLERVNSNLFALKKLYREWTGGGHKVHTTNTVGEFRRDIKLLTNHDACEWENGQPEGELKVLPGHGGWASLRELFAFLDSFLPYVVLRNAEMLPDGFDPSVHGDIDLLVPDAVQCASILGARKVFPESYRVHYEVMVAGAPVRFDFRFLGDDYYDRKWEEKMLENRRTVNGVNLLAPEDAFYALVYHALYQKRAIAADYLEKAAALAEEAGIVGKDYDDWILALEDFLKRNGYEIVKCQDSTVFFNKDNVRWRRFAEEIAAYGPFTEIRPHLLHAISANNANGTRFYRGKFGGTPCFIKYSPVIGNFAREEWRIPSLLISKGFEFAAKPLFWHRTKGGGSIVVTEFVEGETLSSLLARSAVTNELADSLVEQIRRAAAFLRESGFEHRDIRPENLLVDKAGRLKIIDFQFAIARGGFELLYHEPAYMRDNLATLTLFTLGDKYALGHGKWNDDFSFMKCLQILPQTTAVAAALEELAAFASEPRHSGLGPMSVRDRILRRVKKLRRRRILALFGIKRRKFRRSGKTELAELEALLKGW